jgi:Tfp pilus assembly PilM family ATPase
MVFGLSPKARFLCIDIQFDEVYFAVVRKVGDFFEIDFTDRVQIEGGIFEESRLRTPGKIRDVLEGIRKKFGTLSVLTSVPEHFCYATLLPSETYTSPRQMQHEISARVTSSSYMWMSTFQQNTSSYMALHVAEKEACNTLYTLLKTAGFNTVVMYPRVLVLSELSVAPDALVCDFGKKQTTLFSVHRGHTVGFSTVPYGVDWLGDKVKNKFSLLDGEVQEVLNAYGTDVLPRKEGHLVHGIVHTFLSPIVDEARSLALRQADYGLPATKKLFVTGAGARHEGTVEDFSRVTGMVAEVIPVWDGVIDLNSYIPQIHKNDSHEYVGIAGLMNILKKGTRYQPFDL